jgi:HAMP domain-containing protein
MWRLESSWGLFRNRVARRILLLFVACALVPTAALSVIAYRHVSRQLLEETHLRLRQASKTAGMEILQNLQGVRAELNRGAAMLRDGGLGNDLRPLEHGISGLGRSVGGRFQLDAGDMQAPPALPPAQARHVAAGGVALLVDTVTNSPRILLVRRLDPSRDSPLLWAQVAPSFLFGRDGAGALTTEAQELCVFDGDLRPLVCPRPMPMDAVRQAAAGRAGTFPWTGRAGEYVGGYFVMFLGFDYGAPSWSIVLSEARGDVLAPLAGFRRSFLAVVLLALVTVFALSHVQIRRSLTPLDELTQATRRLANQDFSRPAIVPARDEFGQLADSFNAMAVQLQGQFVALRAMHEFDRAALNAKDLDEVAAAILAAVEGTVACDQAVLAVADPHDPVKWRVMALNGDRTAWAELTLPPGARSRLERSCAPLPVSVGDPEFGSLVAAMAGDREALILALRHDAGVTAALVLGVSGRVAESGLLAAAQQLGDQVALALSRAHVINELEELNRGTLTALARAIDANSPWTAGHSERVSAVSQVIGRTLQVSAEDMDRLGRGGLLHDVGKIGVSADILNKPGALTEAEFQQVRSHTTLGAGILMPVRAYHDLIPLVRSHHELLDGSGYPDGLSGAQIPPLVRILTVADVFDALVSDRPYRPALSVIEAMAILRRGAGSKFDPGAVEAFLRVLGRGDAELWQVYPPLGEQFIAWPAARDGQLLAEARG